MNKWEKFLARFYGHLSCFFKERKISYKMRRFACFCFNAKIVPTFCVSWRVSWEVSCMCLCVRSCLIVRNGQADLNLSSKDRKLWGFCAWGFFLLPGFYFHAHLVMNASGNQNTRKTAVLMVFLACHIRKGWIFPNFSVLTQC